jgi:ABC-type nitrate/sulfonate/bicarbonate transport system ATPase subunit
MPVLLQAQNIHKTFKNAEGKIVPVLDGISLDLHVGEIVCLLGASGSGKTTLLRILAGLEQADAGEIHSDISRPGKEFGYLTQGDRLLPWRTTLANVALGLELLGQDKATAYPAALEALKQVGLEAFADSRILQLSGGMQQRALLARTLALRPRLLMLDEPMSNLDVLARRELAGVFRDYVRQNVATALVVTHSIEEAIFLADRILFVTRAPARLFREIRITDREEKDAVPRNEALNVLMENLWSALQAA